MAVGVVPGTQGKPGANGNGEASRQGGEGHRGNRPPSDSSGAPRGERTRSAQQSHEAGGTADTTVVATDADTNNDDASPAAPEPANASGDAAPAEAPAMTAAPASPS
jgi:hypothetical protein